MTEDFEKDTELAVHEQPVISYEDLLAMVMGFQDSLSSLDQRVSAGNFGSKLYQTKETIISKSGIKVGQDDNSVILRADDPDWRIWVGSEDPLLAPFRVSKTGDVFLESVTLSGYPTDDEVVTIIGNTVNATYVNALSIKAGSVDAEDITGSTLTGIIIQTAASGQRVVLFSTLASYYNSSGTKIAETYASSNSFLIKGQTSTSNIYLDAGSSGAVAFLENGTIRAFMDNVNNVFVPGSNYGWGLGAPSAYWGDFYCSDIDCSNITGYDIEGSSFSLNGTTITDWSDIGGSFDLTGGLTDLGALNNVSLNVRRVTTGGVDSGWYGLHFAYGLLDTATVH